MPKIVTPGATDSAPPSDAIVLFDGTNLDQWVNVKDKSPAGWTVADGIFTVNKAAGNIETKRSFKNYQLHIEWRIPEGITGDGPGARQQRPVPRLHRRAATAATSCRSSIRSRTRPTSTARPASIYKQGIPLANASAQTGRVADLRRHLDGADVQRRWLGQDAGATSRRSTTACWYRTTSS